MNAKKCDRCGKFYTREDGDGKTFTAIRCVLCAEDAVAYVDSHYNRESYDFCPECYKELKAFVDKRIDS